MTFSSMRAEVERLRSTFWFVPLVIVLGSVGLAAALIVIDTTESFSFVKRLPLLFGAGASGARGLLVAIATSMITLAGVVFSITIVALSLTSSQYTSRVLRNFMRDRINQAVLGVFVGAFAYCLVVLRTIRAGDEGSFVPALAVLFGLLLAFVSIGFLVAYIHHIAVSIQASSIIATAAEDTVAAVDRLYPDDLIEDREEQGLAPGFAALTWFAVPAPRTGYVTMVDHERLIEWGRCHDTVVRMMRGVGDFVVAGAPLVCIAGTPPDPDTCDALQAPFTIGRHRAVEHDVAFGIRQIVDVALKALSPGINDSTTAVMCVDYLSSILCRLATRELPPIERTDDDGAVRLLARGPSFATLVAEAFDQIRENAGANRALLTRMVQALEVIAVRTPHVRRRVLQAEAMLIVAGARTAQLPPLDVAELEDGVARIEQAFAGVPGRPSIDAGEMFTRT